MRRVAVMGRGLLGSWTTCSLGVALCCLQATRPASAPAAGAVVATVRWDGAPVKLHPFGGGPEVDADTGAVKDGVVVLRPRAASESRATRAGSRPVTRRVTLGALMIKPYVTVARSGDEIVMENADGAFWAVCVRNAEEQPTQEQNAALVKLGHVVKIACQREGVIQLTSEADFRPHASFVYVAGATDLVATTDARGTVRLGHVSAGAYDVRVWHELGTWSGSVTVAAGEAAVDVALLARAGRR